jgi:hypothetical protein
MGHCPFDAALDGLMVHTHSPTHCKKRRVLSVAQQHPRPLDPARRFRARARNRSQRGYILIAQRQFDYLPPSHHDLNPRFRIKEARLQTISAKLNPPHMIGFMESMN